MMVLWELVRHELEVALRTRRVVLLAVLYLAAAVLGGFAINATVAKAEVALVEEVSGRTGTSEEQVRAQLAEHADEMMNEALERLGMEPESIAEPLASSVIAPVFFWCSLAFLPFLIVLSTFDSVSSDLGGRTLCYTTLRAPRGAIVLGKILAQTFVIACITTVCAFVVLLGAAWKTTSLPLEMALRSATWISLVMLSYTAAYVAITSFCSATTSKPIGALIRALLLLVALRLLSLPNGLVESGRLDADGPAGLLRFLRYLSPRYYAHGMWREAGTALISSELAYLAIAAAFSALAIAAVRRRDL